jgi:predicted CXXCH cytochrome family protein
MTRNGRMANRVLPALAGISLFAMVLVASDLYPRGNPHAYFQASASCPKCHVMVGGRPDPGRFSVDSDSLCLGCHQQGNLGRTHPVNVRPGKKYWKMKIPEDFRLDDDGRLMCLTCHAAHGPHVSTTRAFPKQGPISSESTEGTYYKTFFLRRLNPNKGFAALCDACHEKL